MYYIGMMSGTSLDGVDACVVDFTNPDFKLKTSISVDFPKQLRLDLLHLLEQTQVPLATLGELEYTLTEFYAEVVHNLLKTNHLNAIEIIAIGCHGQTVFHSPEGNKPFSMQLLNASVLAMRTGIQVVYDFRNKDIALGGQGAPLVPAFHNAAFYASHEQRALLNLGGIANLSVLAADNERMIGYDLGPANCLMDSWIQQNLSKKYDRDGSWASSGSVSQKLLNRMLSEPYFTMPFPKSTGRELFHLEWLSKHSKGLHLAPEDVQATLCALTVQVAARELATFPQLQAVYVCGGGAKNTFLMQTLQEALSKLKLATTADLGLDTQLVECVAFAWLAQQRMLNKPSNLPSVTGAREAVSLGSIC